MAANLNYVSANSFCYDDKEYNCYKYGRLYTWAAALNVCPTGWHLPTKEEWQALIDSIKPTSTVGSFDVYEKLMSKDWERGKDSYGFAALPAGFRDDDNKLDLYQYSGAVADFWSYTEYSQDSAYYFRIYYDGLTGSISSSKKSGLFSDGSMADARSVRCIKDN